MLKDRKVCAWQIFVSFLSIFFQLYGFHVCFTFLSFLKIVTRPARKSLMFGVALQYLEQFCGCFVLLFYAATVFKQAGSNLSPNVSSIIIGIIQLCGAYVSTMLVDRAGRKFLICLSAFGISIGLFIFGLHSYLSTSSSLDLTLFSWVPLVSFSFVLFIANFGVLTLPFLVMSEVTPPNVRCRMFVDVVFMIKLTNFPFFILFL